MFLGIVYSFLCLQLIEATENNQTEICHFSSCSKGLVDTAVVLDKNGSSLNKTCEDENDVNCILDSAVKLINKAKQRTVKQTIIKAMDCGELLAAGFNRSGNYTIWPKSRVNAGKSINVYCDMQTDGGGWTVIQRRGDFGKPNDYFHRGWLSYKYGFGDIMQDFWLGNDNIFSISNQNAYSIRFDLKTVSGETKYALYDSFWIEDEPRNYTIHIYDYSDGMAGESMTTHNNTRFSTKDNDDKDNDAKKFTGGWWHYNNIYSNLNGLYLPGETNSSGTIWYRFKKYESLKSSKIKLRSKT